MGSLRRSDDSGLTMYVLLRNSSHYAVIATTGVSEAYDSTHLTTYVHTASEQGDTGYYYLSTSDDLASGVYWIEWREQAGESVAESDMVRASGSAYWNGTSWWNAGDIPAASTIATEVKTTIEAAGSKLATIETATVTDIPTKIDNIEVATDAPSVAEIRAEMDANSTKLDEINTNAARLTATRAGYIDALATPANFKADLTGIAKTTDIPTTTINNSKTILDKFDSMIAEDS